MGQLHYGRTQRDSRYFLIVNVARPDIASLFRLLVLLKVNFHKTSRDSTEPAISSVLVEA